MSERDRLLEVLDSFDGRTVALVGDLVLDRFILGTPKRISREAPVIILRWEGQNDIPGGGANALANLVALGIHVATAAAVGDDEPGHALRHALDERGVDTSGIVVVPGYRTPTKVRILGGGASSLKHQVARYDIEDTLPPDPDLRDRLGKVAEEAARRASAVAFSDYGYGTVNRWLVGRVRSAAAASTWTCVDSRYALSEYHGIGGATPNLQELEACAGRPLREDAEVGEAAETLRRRLDARFLLATRGNQGMTLVEDGRAPIHIPVNGTDEVADVTGAGDTVLAVLTAALAAGARPVDAARLANYAGGLVVMKLGTATVSLDELRRAVESDPQKAS
jgi:rfaE bifunctional protein kinase chain/domain